jgi:hypothetical protein
MARILRGIARNKGMNRSSPAVALTVPLLRRLLLWVDGCHLSRHDRLLLVAGYAVAFACCLRTGEWAPRPHRFNPSTHFLMKNLQISAAGMVLTLPASKTDQFRRGTPIRIPSSADSIICARTRLQAYIDFAAAPGDAPLFRFASGRPLDSEFITRWLRLGLTALGVDPTGYSGYSFRHGAATDAAANGAGDRAIMALGRWRSTAFHRYVDAAGDPHGNGCA